MLARSQHGMLASKVRTLPMLQKLAIDDGLDGQYFGLRELLVGPHRTVLNSLPF